MGKRQAAIGIKQVVRIEWYDLGLDLLLDGAKPAQIRKQLDEFISERLQSGGYGERGAQTYTKAVTQIMKCWVTPDKDLKEFRDSALLLGGRSVPRLPLHWAVTVAAYPFWYRVATVIGRLLNLQSTITQSQIRQRCFEGMGERTTVERSARRVIRSFVAWGVLKASETKGCYERATPAAIIDTDLAILMFESALHATPGATGALELLLNNPAFFPFQIPIMSGDFISQHNSRIDTVRYGLDEELLKLKV